MFSRVVVTGNDASQVVIASKENPLYGHIRVEQRRTTMTNKGWVRSKVLSALIHGTVEELESLGFASGEIIPGKIIIKESLTPFNAKDPSVDYKVAGKTGIVCMVDKQPIYRKCFYNPSGTEIDELVSHTNAEQIRLANQVLNEEVTSTEDLDLEL